LHKKGRRGGGVGGKKGLSRKVLKELAGNTGGGGWGLGRGRGGGHRWKQ